MTLILVGLYVVGVLIAIPVVGRSLAAYYEKQGYRGRSEITPLWGGIFWGLMWPFPAILLVGGWIYGFTSHAVKLGWLKRLVTGTDNDF